MGKYFFPLARRECLILIGLLVLILLIFLPWTFDHTYLGIALNSWFLVGMHLLVPLIGLWLMRGKKKK